MQKIAIDPISRVEGHLKIETLVDQGVVKEASVSGTMFRGFEIFLKGRDPWDAQRLVQRVCGVCPAIHGVAAAQNLDAAFGITQERQLIGHNQSHLGQGVRLVGLEGEAVAELGSVIESCYAGGVTFPLGYTDGVQLYLPITRMLGEGDPRVSGRGDKIAFLSVRAEGYQEYHDCTGRK